MSTSIEKLLPAERIVHLKSKDKQEALRALCKTLVPACGEDAIEPIYGAVLEREQLLSTGIGLGLAIPHAIVDYVKDYAMALAVLDEGIEFEALDEAPVRLLALIVGPQGRKEEYLKILARTAKFLKQRRTEILAAKTPEEIHALAKDF